MKFILENKISLVSASSENTNFPAKNVLDVHPKRMWKAANGVRHARLSCDIGSSADGGAGGIAIFNTNATNAIINISDPNEIIWVGGEWVNVSWPINSPFVKMDLNSNGTSNTIWAEYAKTDSSLVADIIITADTTVYCGVVVAGEIVRFRDPVYGVSQSLHDYSIESEYSNGSYYYDKKDIVRIFSGVLLTRRDNNFYRFMHSYARKNGKKPVAMRLTENESFEWVVYARLQDMPSGSHYYRSYSNINFNIIEVL